MAAGARRINMGIFLNNRKLPSIHSETVEKRLDTGVFIPSKNKSSRYDLIEFVVYKLFRSSTFFVC